MVDGGRRRDEVKQQTQIIASLEFEVDLSAIRLNRKEKRQEQKISMFTL